MHSVSIVLSAFYLVSASGQALDASWNSDSGTVSLKAKSNPSLCVTAVPYDNRKSVSFLQIIDCSQEFPGYEGDRRFDIDEISDGVYRFRTSIFPEGEKYPQHACFSTVGVENSIALTENCDRSNTWQHWTFPKISPNKYQLKHKNTGKCIRSPQISNGTTLVAADCDVNDQNQIYDGEFLKQDWKWEKDGYITLKPASDASLCMRTEQNDKKTSRINLASCEKEYETYKGNKRMELGKVPEGYYEMRTVHVPVGSAYGQFGCLWTGLSNGSKITSPVLTDDCNYNNSWQYWKFIEISPGRVQLMHKKTGTCIKAMHDKSTVVTANCDKNDVNQIWIKEYDN